MCDGICSSELVALLVHAHFVFSRARGVGVMCDAMQILHLHSVCQNLGGQIACNAEVVYRADIGQCALWSICQHGLTPSSSWRDTGRKPVHKVPAMSSISSISLSGMNAAQTALSASAFNIANLGTDGFRRQQVKQTSVAPAGVSATLTRSSAPGDADLVDMLGMLQSKNSFLANLAVFKTSTQMAGTFLATVG